METYIEAIQDDVSINWPKFKRLMRRSGVQSPTIDAVFSASQISEDNWFVDILDQSLFEELRSYLGIGADTSSRPAAAFHGLAHGTEASGSLVVVSTPRAEGLVVYECVGAQWRFHGPLPPTLILIENLECFLHRDRMLAFLSEHCGWPVSRESVDIAYAAGLGVSSHWNRGWLSAYQTILCVTDVDTGGFRIFDRVRKLAGDATVEFVVPDHIDSILSKTNRRLTERQRETLAAYAQVRESPLSPIATLLLRHGKSIEQEVYLNEC